MSIYNISLSNTSIENFENDIDTSSLENISQINNLDTLTKKSQKNLFTINSLTIDELLDFFDKLSQSWTTIDSNFQKKFGYLGISFLIHFLSRQNLEQILKTSLKNDIKHLDTFIFNQNLNKSIMAHPKGTIIHWLAGNVPVLGMLSLVQGIITKNINIVKLPRENGFILPKMVQEIYNYSTELKSGKKISGKDIFGSTSFVYCSKDDIPAQTILSKAADVRVAWGGKEAVEGVLRSPKKYWADDVIFGPKYSFVVIGKNSFPKENLDNLAYRIALDASIFEQQGCNSPHTIFVEKNGEVDETKVAQAIAKAMQKVLKRIPKPQVSPAIASNVINIRAEYDFLGEVFCSEGTEWTVILSDEQGVADACYSRTLFVRPIDNINQILNYIDHSKQTMGLSICNEDKLAFSINATRKGIERITDLGKMSVYDHPWDGMFPMERFIRWVSLY
jgi:hypothetical protein